MSNKNVVFSKDVFKLDLNNINDFKRDEHSCNSYFKYIVSKLFKDKLAVIGFVIITVIFIMCITVPMFSSYKYFMPDYSSMNQPPSLIHWFGTDDMGRDLFVRAWQAGRVSLFIGVLAALTDFNAGVIYGGISGYLGGKTDNFMMSLSQAVYSIPYLIMVILVSVVIGNSIFSIITAMTITGWVPMARLVRGQVLQLKELEYIQAAKSFGADTKWILFKHLIPNAISPIVVTVTLTVPRAIFAEATLSFLGLGVQPPTPSWGQMASEAIQQMVVGNINALLVPSALICLTIFSFNVLGDGLCAALDPKFRR